MPRVREPGIPGLEQVARKIREEVGIPPFPDHPDPVTGRYRPIGWYMVRRGTGERVVPVDRGQIVQRKTSLIDYLFRRRRSP